MKIGLFGFTFTHENMGCQALTCSFLEYIRKCCSSSDIEVIVFRNEVNLGNIPSLFPEMRFRLVRVSFHDPKLQFLKEIKKCDIIFDETYGDGFSDIYFTKSVYRDTLVKDIIAYSKVPFVLTPQTYGPFKHKTLEWLSARAIRKADYACARDNLSAEYASTISRRRVECFTDIAFSLPFSHSLEKTNKYRVGINVSGLLWQGGFSDSNQFNLKVNYRQFCKDVIALLLDRGYEVHIIPHVTKSSDANRIIPDGDYPACLELKQEYEDTILAPCFNTPYEAKNYISNMDFFIGARMHSTIASFSSGVKTIPFAYSRKFQGLYDDLNYPYYIDGCSMSTKDALEKLFGFLDSPDEIENALEKGNIDINSKLHRFEETLKQIFQNVKGD